MTFRQELCALRFWPLAWPMVVTLRLADLAADAGDEKYSFERGSVVILLGATFFVPLLPLLVLIQIPILVIQLAVGTVRAE